MVADVEVVRRHLTDRLDDNRVVLAARRHTVFDEVRQCQKRGSQLLVRRVLLGLRGLDLVLERLRLLDQRGALVGGRGLDRLAGRVGVRPQRVGARHRRPTALIGSQDLVDEILGGATVALATPESVRVVA